LTEDDLKNKYDEFVYQGSLSLDDEYYRRFVAFCAQMGLKVMVSSEQYNNDNNKTRQWKNYVVSNGQLIKSDCK